MRRQPTSRQGASPEDQMMGQMGIFQDPMQQMHGLVQLLNALDQPDQWQQEMDYRRAGQEQAGQQFQQSAQMQGRGLDQRQAAQDMQEKQWAREMGLRTSLADEEKVRFLQKEENDKQMANLTGLFGLLERLPSFAMNGMPPAPGAAGKVADMIKPGLGSLFAAPTTAPVTTRATNPQQALQEQKARELGIIK